MRLVSEIFLSVCIIIVIAGCAVTGVPVTDAPEKQVELPEALVSNSEPSGSPAPPGSQTGTVSAPNNASPSAGHGEGWIIRVENTAGEILFEFTEAELRTLLQAGHEINACVYSTINNWPSARFFVAEGWGVRGLLQASGVFETVRRVTIRAADGYEVSLTREQLFGEQFYFPRVGESFEEAVPVEPMIAYRWREGTDDISEVRDDKPVFIFGQRTPYEHTNPAFVVGVAEIIVDFEPCEAWQAADTFPRPGLIEPGETVKLQHPFFGLVKMYYTLDGSEPTMLSALYNPSTYQTELNKPIPVTEPVTIKVLVTGYGRDDSEVAVFDFRPE